MVIGQMVKNITYFILHKEKNSKKPQSFYVYVFA